MSLRARIISYYQREYSKHDNFVNAKIIEDKASKAGYKPSNAGRRCRELAREGWLEREMQGKSVAYRWLPKETLF